MSRVYRSLLSVLAATLSCAEPSGGGSTPDSALPIQRDGAISDRDIGPPRADAVRPELPAPSDALKRDPDGLPGNGPAPDATAAFPTDQLGPRLRWAGTITCSKMSVHRRFPTLSSDTYITVMSTITVEAEHETENDARLGTMKITKINGMYSYTSRTARQIFDPCYETSIYEVRDKVTVESPPPNSSATLIVSEEAGRHAMQLNIPDVPGECVFRRDLGADSGGTWAGIPE